MVIGRYYTGTVAAADDNGGDNDGIWTTRIHRSGDTIKLHDDVDDASVT